MRLRWHGNLQAVREAEAAYARLKDRRPKKSQAKKRKKRSKRQAVRCILSEESEFEQPTYLDRELSAILRESF